MVSIGETTRKTLKIARFSRSFPVSLARIFFGKKIGKEGHVCSQAFSLGQAMHGRPLVLRQKRAARNFLYGLRYSEKFPPRDLVGGGQNVDMGGRGVHL